MLLPTGKFSFAIDTILPALVPASQVVNNPCRRHLSPVASSVAFSFGFFVSSSLAVDLLMLFLPKNHVSTHVPTTFYV